MIENARYKSTLKIMIVCLVFWTSSLNWAISRARISWSAYLLARRCFLNLLTEKYTISCQSSCLSCLPCPIQSFMSCSHLLVGLPLPLLPSILASKMCLSSVSWRLMWSKYLSFSVFAFCRSIVCFSYPILWVRGYEDINKCEQDIS